MSLLVLACGNARAVPANEVREQVPAGAGLVVDGEVTFEGMCDASGAVELDARTFMIADDEDNVLRVYDAERGGRPLAAIDVSPGVGLVARGKKRPRAPELDLEAATRIGERAYWLTSHGRDSRGRARPERLKFFATTLPARGDDASSVTVVGSTGALIDALMADPRYAAFGLAAAAARAPKDEGGLNLEGMTATPEGTLLLGFRNPVPDGLALLFTIEAPARAVEGELAFGAPVRLDLGGLGVRALTWWRDRYVIVAGPRDRGGPSRLYAWDGRGAPVRIDVDLAAYNPEATFSPDGGARMMVLSDDGGVEVDGVPCKQVKDDARKRFRGVWLREAAR